MCAIYFSTALMIPRHTTQTPHAHKMEMKMTQSFNVTSSTSISAVARFKYLVVVVVGFIVVVVDDDIDDEIAAADEFFRRVGCPIPRLRRQVRVRGNGLCRDNWCSLSTRVSNKRKATTMKEGQRCLR